MARMKITVVDPPAYTPPYDHCFCAALAQRGLDVELATSRFRHGPVPEAVGYRRSESFYRWGPAGSRFVKAAQHPIDMLRLARRVRSERRDIVHFQWLPIPTLDRRTLTSFPRPRVLTAHDVLPRDVGPRRRRAARRLFDFVDVVVVHSEHGRGRLVNELGVPSEKVHVTPHGAFEYMTSLPEEGPIDPAAGPLEGRKVVLCLGLMRPYKGIDLLIEAFRSAPEDAVLLLAGKAMMPIEPLRRRAQELGIGDRVRFVPRFVTEPEIPAYFRRADLVVLPYREIEQSGVLATALAFGVPLLLTSVGGFTEIGERHGAARLVPAGDVASLGNALAELLRDDTAREALAGAARRAATGPYSWSRAAELTEGLYSRLLERAKASRAPWD
jgi:glycosyltransferase involved in cell wall biosynthesis